MAQAYPQAPQTNQQFTPEFNSSATKRAIKFYKNNRKRVSPEELNKIRQHAQYHNIPFYEGDFSIVDAITQAAGGLLEGFTTLNVVDAPDNEYEAIARNIGHLIGFAPGILGGPVAALKPILGIKKVTNATNILRELNKWSVPMASANFATKRAKTFIKGAKLESIKAKGGAYETAYDFLTSEPAKHIAEGAFHLGVASAASNVWHGVDGMLEGAFGGAIAGGAFRGIGNAIKLADPTATKFVRGLAGSLFMGLNAEMRGATTPEKIYDYLLGAYFGGKETSWKTAKVNKVYSKVREEQVKDPRKGVLRDPELTEEFAEQSEDIKLEVRKKLDDYYKGTEAAHQEALFELLVKTKGEKEAREILKMPKEGVPEDVTKKVRESIEGKEVEKAIQENLDKKEAPDVSVQSKKARARAKELARERKKIDKEIDKLQKEIDSFPDKEYDVPFNESIRKGTPIGKLRQKSRELSDKRYKLDKEIEAVLDSAGLLKKPKKIDKPEKPKYIVTGGDKGIEEAFSKKAIESGRFVGQYVIEGQSPVGKGVNIRQLGLSQKVETEATKKLQKVIEDTKVNVSKFTPYQMNLMKRDWSKVKYSEALYVVDNLSANLKTIKSKIARSPKWAVHMAINEKKPIYVFDNKLKSWFEYNYSKGRFTDIKGTPKLVDNFAALGKVEGLKPEDFKAVNTLFKMEKDYNELAKKKVPTRPLENTKKETPVEEVEEGAKSTVEDGFEVGESFNLSRYDKKMEQIIEDYVADSLPKDILKDPIAFMTEKGFLAKKLGHMAVDFLDINTKRNRSEEFIDNVESELSNQYEKQILIPSEARGLIRQWFFVQNQSKPTMYVSGDVDRTFLINPDNPFTGGNKIKKNMAPDNEYDILYKNLNGNLKEIYKDVFENPTAVLDYITINGQDYNISKALRALTDMNWKQTAEQLKRIPGTFKFNQETSKKEFAGIIGKKIQEMKKKYNMLPLGGASDKDRIIFVKEHPFLTNNKKLKTLAPTLKTSAKSSKIPMLRKLEARAKEYFGMDSKMHWDAYRNNLLYDLTLNGIDPTNNKAVIEFVKNPKKHYLKSAMDNNKRMALLVNPGYKGDKQFALENHKKYGAFLDKNGDYSYVLIKDPKKQKEFLKLLNNQTEEHVDGAIIGHDGTIDLEIANAGVPKSGNLKTVDFIEPTGKHGAQFNKPMYHKAGPELSKMMEKAGINFIKMDTAAKQRGGRESGSYDIVNGNLVIKDAPIYKMNSGNMRYNFSVIQDRAMLGYNHGGKHIGMRFVKQAQTNLHPDAFAAIDADLIKNIVHETSGKSYIGQDSANSLVRDYLTNYKQGSIDKIIQNFEEIGVKEVFDVLKDPQAAELANRMLLKIMRADRQITADMAADGELSQNQANEYLESQNNYMHSADRLFKIISSIPDKNINTLLMDANIGSYLQTAVHNWSRDKVLRPRVKNALAGRMRPYDPQLQKKFPELNDDKLAMKKYGLKADEIFYLGDYYRDTPIETLIGKIERKEAILKTSDEVESEYIDFIKGKNPDDLLQWRIKGKDTLIPREQIPDFNPERAKKTFAEKMTKESMGKEVYVYNESLDIFEPVYKPGQRKFANLKNTTLGELWDAYQSLSKSDPKRTEFEEVFRAMNIRVPADSLSGSQIMHFKGFTGIKDHGILMHGRSMRAEGGADLDADEAFIYFGGKNEMGKGQGMKQSWLDAYYAQKKEYYNKAETELKIEKSKYEKELLNEVPKDIQEFITTPELRFSPFSRLFASQQTANARNMLGPVSSLTSTMRAAWSSMLNKNFGLGGSEVIKEEGNVRYIKEPKFKSSERERQRELTWAMIAFGSDPDYAMKSYVEIFNKLHDAYFDVSVEVLRGSGNKKEWKKLKSYVHGQTKDVNGVKPPSYSELADAGVVGDMRAFNRANFARNYEKNRKWTPREIQDILEVSKNYDSDASSTVHPLWAKLLYERIPEYRLLDNVNLEKLMKTYTNYEKMIKSDEKMPFIDAIKNFTGRTSVRVKKNDFANKDLIEKLLDDVSLKAIARDKVLFEDIIYKKDRYGNFKEKAGERILKFGLKKFGDASKGGVEEAFLPTADAYKQREIILERIRDLQNEYISQDMHDMATTNLLMKPEIQKLSPELLEQMHIKSEEFKLANNIKYIARNTKKDVETPLTNKEHEAQVAMYLLQKQLLSAGVAKSVVAPKPQEKMKSAMADLADINTQVKIYKDTLPNSAAREAFDYMMIGSLRRNKNYKELQKLYNVLPEDIKKSDFFKQLKREMEISGSKTNINRLAADIPSVSDQALRNFYKEKLKFFKNEGPKITKQQEAKIEKDIKEFEKEIEPFATKESIDYVYDKRIEGHVLDNLTHYEGLHQGKLSRENAKIVAELADHLNMIPDFMNKDLAKVMEGIWAKHIANPTDPFIPKFNQLTVKDLDVYNQWFRQIKAGNVYQRLENYLNPKLKGRLKGIKKRYHMLFPEEIAMESMEASENIKFLASQGYFLTKSGMPEKNPSIILKPHTYGENIINWTGKMHDSAQGVGEKLISNYEREVQFLDVANEHAEAIYKAAWFAREAKGQPKDIKMYQEQLDNHLNSEAWIKASKKTYNVSFDGAKKEIVSADKMVNHLMKKFDNLSRETHKLIKGDRKFKEKYFLYYENPKAKTESEKKPVYDYYKFLVDMNKAMMRGEEFGMELGIDGTRHMTRSMLIGIGKEVGLKPEVMKIYNDWVVKDTGFQPGYMPHVFPNAKKSANQRDIELAKIRSNKNLSAEEKQIAMERTIFKYKTVRSDDISDFQYWEKIDRDLFRDTVQGMSKKKIAKEENVRFMKADERFSQMFNRENHTPDYLVDHTAWHSYLRQISRTYFRQLAHMMNKMNLHKMNQHMYERFVKPANLKDKPELLKLTSDHIEFWRQYASQAMGYPVHIPKDVYNDPDMKIKGTPYGWWADNRVRDKLNNIWKKLGFGNKNLPDNLQGFESSDIQHFSNIEGQYNLMTLMTHPKTITNNLFGGSLQTYASTGHKPLMQVRDYKYLQTIDPSLKTRSDVVKHVERQGVVPEQILYELGFDSAYKTSRGQSLLKDMVNQVFTNNKKAENLNIVELAKKHGVGTTLVNKAAKFMTVPERALRTDAYMAHLIKAYQRMGGAITNINHPILVEIAKKGVKATQFLYNAPNRPGFARTGFGKVMTRFQLWSWNAMRFRNQLRKQAKLYGYEPGSEAMERFVRTFQTDMITLALGNMFMYSLFEQVLPAPWSYFQDTADWLFGDERTRDRAFFGTYPTKLAPLSLITPPVARIPISFIRQFAEDDYNRLAEYYIWTMFPFGRIGRDLLHPEQSLLNNPMRMPEKLIGFPLTGLAKKASEYKDEDRYKSKAGAKIIDF